MTPPAEEEPELVPAGEAEAEPELAPAPVSEPTPLAETAAEIEDIDADAPRVAILAEAKDDLETLERAQTELTDREIRSETRVLSADDDADALAEYADNAQLRGIRVVIAGTGTSARLPSALTAHTELPVIGVPLTSQGARAGDLDPLLSGNPTPPQDPVAWVGLDGARQAAVLAARILGA